MFIHGKENRSKFKKQKIFYSGREIQFKIKKNIYQGSTPLLLAASSGLADVVQMLCSRGADPRKLDRKGRGILQLAEKCGKGR